MNTYELDLTALRNTTEDLIKNGENEYRATVMALWIVKEGITVDAARERVGNLWLD